MRILQLIDSLHTGGGEMMAVHLANLLKDEHESHLMVTRTEGPLKQKILPGVHYQFLGKKSSIDPLAFLRFIRYIRKHKIQIVHAHSTSVFMPLLLRKLLPRKTKIVWHDHHGVPVQERAYFKMLKKLSDKIDFYLAISPEQERNNLHYLDLPPEKHRFLRNFAVLDTSCEHLKKENSIVLLANLHDRKNQFLAVDALSLIKETLKDWKVQFIGKDDNDDYSKKLKKYISDKGLNDIIEIVANKSVTGAYLCQAKIGILSSKAEGLPLAILEYGLAGLAVVSTNVGGISDVIEHEVNGLLVPPGNARKFAGALASLIEHESVRQLYARRLQEKVKKNYSADNYKNRLTEIYGRLLSS